MMVESLSPGETPVSLNEARGWLRLGTTIDDAVIAGLVRARRSLCWRAMLNSRGWCTACSMASRRGRARLMSR